MRRAGQHAVRILDDWPTADTLTRAYQRVALITCAPPAPVAATTAPTL